jgi:hypothetical protein
MWLAAGAATEAAAQAGPQLAMMDSISVLDFGRQTLGSAGAARSLTFTNSGTDDLSILRVAMAGLHPQDFAVSGDLCTNATLTAASSCTVTVNFVATAAGLRSARLLFETGTDRYPLEMPVSGQGIDPANPVRLVGPVDLRYTFPLWYQDVTGLRLELCLDTNGMCLGKLPDPALPPSVADASVNFPGEAFWWYAESKITRPNGGKVLLVLSKEATFMNGTPVVGDQIAFDRIRIRIDRLSPGQTYRVTHPFGTADLKADLRGEIYVTQDVGCLNTPCDFQRPMTSSFTTFLRWDPNAGAPAPDGYIGDPNVAHKVAGSPAGTNFFKVEGPNAGGPNINVIQSDLFNVQGKVR